MPLSQTPYTLTAQQLDAALAALAKASETFRLSLFERVIYRALGICATTAIVAFIVAFSLVAAGPQSWTAIFLIIGLVTGAVAILLLFASFSLVLKTVRQRGLLKKFGLHEVSNSAWKAQRKGRWFARILGTVLTIMGLLVLLFSITPFVTDMETELFDYVMVGFFFLAASSMLLWRFLRRRREQLAIAADAERLRATLTAMQAGAESHVVVSAEVLEKVASIEQAQIARDRAHAVLAGVKAANRGYSVLIARDVSEQKTSLPPECRLEVEELIERVVAEQSASAVGPGGRIRIARTPDGSAEVDYSVDEPNRRIQIIAIRTSTAVCEPST